MTCKAKALLSYSNFPNRPVSRCKVLRLEPLSLADLTEIKLDGKLGVIDRLLRYLHKITNDCTDFGTHMLICNHISTSPIVPENDKIMGLSNYMFYYC